MATIGSGWKYKRSVEVDNSNNSNALSNYQVRVDLNSDNFDYSEANSDGSDIRFTDEDQQTLIDFWIEKWDSTGQSAILWAEVPSVPASSKKNIYMYYGNAGATSASNGDNTFLFFDDFDGTALDTNKWTEHYLEGSAGGSASVANSELTVQQLHQDDDNHHSYQVYGNTNFLNKAVRIKAKFPDYTATAGRTRGGWVGFSESTALENNVVEVAAWEGGTNVNKIYDVMSGGTRSSLDITPDVTVYHTYDLLWISSSSCKFSYDDVYEGEITTNIPTVNLPVSIIARTWSNSGYDVRSIVDWVAVREFSDPEPAFSSAGSENTETSIKDIIGGGIIPFPR